MKKIISSAVLTLFVLGCEEAYSPPGTTAPLSATTSSILYGVNDPIVVYVANSTTDPISFDRWDGTIFYYRDKLTDTGWQEWTQIGIYPTSEKQRFILPSEQTYADTILVRKPGVYRFRFPVLHNDDPSRTEMLVTNSFSIQ